MAVWAGSTQGQLRVLADSPPTGCEFIWVYVYCGQRKLPPPAGELRLPFGTTYAYACLNDNVYENHAFQKQSLGEEIALFYCFAWK